MFAAAAVNLTAIRTHLPEAAGRVDRLEGWLRRRLDAAAPLLVARQATGRVRECHGDLHLANIVLHDGRMTAFDAIEFSDNLRWIDVANDVAFLVMDLKARGRADLAAEVVSSWVEATGDHESLAVLPIYEAYRAIVRASIAAIRGGQGDGAARGEGLKYLDLAERLAVGEPPAMIVTCGMSGSGKSTVAAELVGPLAGVRIRSDVERKRLVGMRPTDRPADAVATDALYDESCTRRVYDRLATLAGTVLDAGRTVVVDATCIKRWQRDRLAAVALARGVPLIWVVFDLPTEAVLARLATRQAAGGDPSDASVAVVRRQLAASEPLANEEAFGNAAIVRVAATDGPAEPAAVAERVVRARSTLP